jgi:excisionase family DNA binding protein
MAKKLDPSKLITTAAVAEELGVTPNRVRALIQAGRLEAHQVGREWLIERAAVDAVRQRKPGRPPGRSKKSK